MLRLVNARRSRVKCLPWHRQSVKTCSKQWIPSGSLVFQYLFHRDIMALWALDSCLVCSRSKVRFLMVESTGSLVDTSDVVCVITVVTYNQAGTRLCIGKSRTLMSLRRRHISSTAWSIPAYTAQWRSQQNVCIIGHIEPLCGPALWQTSCALHSHI